MPSEDKSGDTKANGEEKSNARMDVCKDSKGDQSEKEDISRMSAQKGKKVTYRRRKEILLTFMQAAGSWMLSRAVAEKLAKDFNVSDRTIFRDRLRIIRSVPKPDVKETAGKFLISYDDMITEVFNLKRNENPDIKLRAIKLFFEAVESYTRFLESYGFKEMSEERIRISGEINKGSEARLMAILDKYIK